MRERLGLNLATDRFQCARGVFVGYNFCRFISERGSLIAVVCLSVCLSVCLKRSCTLLRRLKFSAIFRWRLVPWPSVNIHEKFYGDRLRGTPPPGELNTRGLAKYRDFGPIEGYLGNGAR